MNKIFFWKCSNKGGYSAEKIKEIKDLEDLFNCFKETNLLKNMFAAFKNEYKPIQEEEINKFKLTYAWKDEPKDYEKFLKTCWEERIFDKEEVNGIYCSNKKISIWLNNKCDIKVFKKLGYQNTVRPVNVPQHMHVLLPDLSLTKITVIKFWTIGAFNSKTIQILKNRKIFDPMKSEEEILFKYITEKYHFNYNLEDQGIYLTTNIITKNEWRIPNNNNRFVYCSIKISLKFANAILLKLFLSLPFSIFPKVSNIYLAFCFYSDEILEIGIYLNGNNKIFNEGIWKRTGDDPAMILAHKLKQIVLDYCNLEENVLINIVNSVPAENSFFTDSNCEFDVFNPRRRIIKI